LPQVNTSVLRKINNIPLGGAKFYPGLHYFYTWLGGVVSSYEKTMSYQFSELVLWVMFKTKIVLCFHSIKIYDKPLGSFNLMKMKDKFAFKGILFI